MTDTKTNILNEPLENKNQAKQWAKDKGATEIFIGLADLYWKLYKDLGGVNPLVAYAQAALETGYGKFGGAVKEEFKNPCGLKTAISTDDSPDAHAKFRSWELGVQAHLEHLALYAGANGYPKIKVADPKHFQYLFGVCKFVEDLGGKWAPALDYGIRIIKLINEIRSTEIVEEFEEIFIDNKEEIIATKDSSVKEIEDNIETIGEILVNVKKKCIDKINVSNEKEAYIVKLENENNKLNEENKSLKEKVEEYRKILETIYSLLESK